MIPTQSHGEIRPANSSITRIIGKTVSTKYGGKKYSVLSVQLMVPFKIKISESDFRLWC